MKPSSIPELKKALQFCSKDELISYCLAMARFKLETKELLDYLVFSSENEAQYVANVKTYIKDAFDDIEVTNYYFIKKRLSKILRQVKRYIRYSKNKDTEAQVLLFFCEQLLQVTPAIKHNKVLTNMYNKQLQLAKNAVLKLHEDLQYDYNLFIDALPSL